jgi:hypothetical protein
MTRKKKKKRKFHFLNHSSNVKQPATAFSILSSMPWLSSWAFEVVPALRILLKVTWRETILYLVPWEK